jgi:riboflavin synthase
VLKAAKSTRSPDFGGEFGLRVAFAVCRLVLGLIRFGSQCFGGPKRTHNPRNRMFSGLVEATSLIIAVLEESGGVRLVLERPIEFTDVQLGDSIAIQGCCLTVIEVTESSLSFQAGRETLSRTSLGQRKAGDKVNCERSLKLGDRLGGHFVTGHIDGQGALVSRDNEAEWSNMVFSARASLLRQMASKGSVAIEGVSLTLVDVTNETFSVALIPHTLAHTTLGELKAGDVVNLESDLLAKYVQRQLETGLVEGRNPHTPAPSPFVKGEGQNGFSK